MPAYFYNHYSPPTFFSLTGETGPYIWCTTSTSWMCPDFCSFCFSFFFFCFLWLPSREWGNYSRTCASYSHFPLKREKYNNLVNCFCLACFLQNSPINIPFTSRDAVIQVFLHWFWLWKVWKWHQCFPQFPTDLWAICSISCRSSKFCWWRQSPVLDCLLEVLVLACSLRSVI